AARARKSWRVANETISASRVRHCSLYVRTPRSDPRAIRSDSWSNRWGCGYHHSSHNSSLGGTPQLHILRKLVTDRPDGWHRPWRCLLGGPQEGRPETLGLRLGYRRASRGGNLYTGLV